LLPEADQKAAYRDNELRDVAAKLVEKALDTASFLTAMGVTLILRERRQKLPRDEYLQHSKAEQIP